MNLSTNAKILFFLDSIQDLELLSALIRHAVSSRANTVTVWISDSLDRRGPRARRFVERINANYRVIDRWQVICGWVPRLRQHTILITASESNARPHLAAHQLTKIAKFFGVRTFTLQHGLENIGLTYFDRRYAPSRVQFASDVILIWGTAESLHRDVRTDVRHRCISVGCPKETAEAASAPRPPGAVFVVAIFENLHWNRYDRIYRESFLSMISELIARFSDVTFVVKLHPDHRGYAKRRFSRLPKAPNVIVVDPWEAEWDSYSAAGILRFADAAITTPSTVALDAVRQDVPIAVFSGHLDFQLYDPLQRLVSSEDAIAFIERCRQPAARGLMLSLGRTFREKAIISGDAVRAIFATLDVA